MKISKVFGREIINSSGLPALSCEIVLEDGTFVGASVASEPGIRREEVFVLKDGGSRCAGQGLQKAVYNIESLVAPAFIGKVPEVHVFDAILSELDATPEKRNLGANVTLAASLAVCKAQAAVEQLEVFETVAQLSGSASVSLPFPLVTLLSNGTFSNGMPFDSIMLVPVGAQNFRLALEYASTVFHECVALLRQEGKPVVISETGGIFSPTKGNSEPLDLVMRALKNTGMEGVFVLGVDIGAQNFFNEARATYAYSESSHDSEELIAFYKKLCDTYPLYSLENGLSWQDIKGNAALFEALGTTIQIASNHGFMHNATLLQGLGAEIYSNASIIRLCENATVTEFLESIQTCQERGLNTVIASSPGETNEDILADLAVGTSSGQMQGGGINRGEHLAKYNRLLFIEDLLSSELLTHA